MIGETLGHYRIVQLLGKGGMGEVYVADDTRLNRRVALKVLPGELAGDPERRARFEREAQAVAALNHPNIVTIHSVEEIDGTHFITMELVEGQTLSELIPKDGFPLDRFLALAIPLSDAIAVAHQNGVTHRDLKPENVMVGNDGRLRILDFGLAKLAEGPIRTSSEGSDDLPTQTVTQEGRVLGTVAYMSPEQAEGRPVDHRTDVFSLGVMFYEMATGQRPFAGDTSMSVLTSILRDEPSSVTDLNVRLPRQLGRFVKRCLQKDPDRRYQSALDLRNELEELREEVASGQITPVGAAATTGSKGPRWLVPAALVLAAVGLGFGVWSWLGRDRGAPAATSAERMFESMQIRSVTSTGTARLSAISPDGKYVAYVAGDNPEGVLRVKQIATGSDVDIFRPEGEGLWFHQVMFANDGDYILFVAGTDFDRPGDLWQIPTLGGTPRRLSGGIHWGSGVSLAPDGERLALSWSPTDMTGPAHELWIGDLAGGEPQKVFTLPESQMLQSIAWSPNGGEIAVATFDFQGARSGVSLVPVAGGEPALLGERRWTGINQIAWYPDGSGLVVVAFKIGLPGNQIWEVRYPSGETRRITNDLNDYAGVSLTADGQTMALVQTDQRSSLWLEPLPDGEPTQLATTTGNENGVDGVAFLPGGELLFTADAGTQIHLWAVRPDGTGARQITTESPYNIDPYVGGPDSLITYTSFDGEKVGVFAANPDGSERRSLTPEEPMAFNVGLSPDGNWVYYQTLREGALLLHRRPVAGGQAELVLDGHAHAPSWSHDGSRLALHRSDPDDGRWKTFIYSTGDDELLSVEDFHSEGISPWGPADESLYHLQTVDGVQNLFLMPFDGSAPEQITHFTEGEVFSFAISPDGSRLALAHGQTLRDIVLIENFR